MKDRIQIKEEAKGVVRSARVNAYLFTLLFLGITWVLSWLDNYVNASSTVENYAVLYPEIAPYLPSFPEFPALLVTFVGVVGWLIGILLEAGYIRYHLGVRQGKEMPYSTILDGLSFVGKVILLNLVIMIFVGLWSILLVVPGIIAAYRYRFALYNLCENPNIGVMEALRMSKVQTAGHKGKLFVLDLSFLGWGILSMLTLDILNIWVAPYRVQSNIGYFEELKRVTGVGHQPGGPDGKTEDEEEFIPIDPFEEK